jgi:AcrR family transcriptional regulator
VAVLIAMQAGIAHGSFYTYFGSKTEVFRTLVN